MGLSGKGVEFLAGSAGTLLCAHRPKHQIFSKEAFLQWGEACATASGGLGIRKQVYRITLTTHPTPETLMFLTLNPNRQGMDLFPNLVHPKTSKTRQASRKPP